MNQVLQGQLRAAREQLAALKEDTGLLKGRVVKAEGITEVLFHPYLGITTYIKKKKGERSLKIDPISRDLYGSVKADRI